MWNRGSTVSPNTTSDVSPRQKNHHLKATQRSLSLNKGLQENRPTREHYPQARPYSQHKWQFSKKVQVKRGLFTTRWRYGEICQQSDHPWSKYLRNPLVCERLHINTVQTKGFRQRPEWTITKTTGSDWEPLLKETSNNHTAAHGL